MSVAVEQQRTIEITAVAFAELEHLLEDRSASLDRFRRELRELCVRHDWSWFGEKRVFNRRALGLFKNYHYSRRCADRMVQLAESNYAFWILRTGLCERHEVLDRITLPPDHPFWRHFTPPSCWDCGCHLTGSNNANTVARLGGDLSKLPLVNWVAMVSALTDPFWTGSEPPTLLAILEAVIDGEGSTF